MWTVPAGHEAPARQAAGANYQCGQSQQVMKLPRDKRQVPITNVDGKCLGALRVPKSKITPVIIVTVQTNAQSGVGLYNSRTLNQRAKQRWVL